MKKTFTVISTTIASLLLIGISSGASAASNSATVWDSKGTVSFSQNNTVPPVTNPNIPDKQPDITGVAGPLSIDYASDLDFSSHQVQSGTHTYYAKADAITGGALQVRVHDQRGATSGWSLSVKQASQFTNGSATLDGAQINFNKGKTYNIAAGQIYVPTYNSSIETSGALVPGATSGVTVMTGDGTVGGYATLFGTSSDYTANTDGTTSTPVSLVVPSAKVGNFSTILEYTLTAAL